MKEYTVLKLINGYDIICSYVQEKSVESSIEVVDPMIIVSSISRDGVSMVYLKRYNVLAASDRMAIRKTQVISSYPPRKELVRYYLSMLNYYKQEVDDNMARQLDMTTELFEESLKKEQTDMKKKIDTTLEEMFEEYEKELINEIEKEKKTKKIKVH